MKTAIILTSTDPYLPKPNLRALREARSLKKAGFQVSFISWMKEDPPKEAYQPFQVYRIIRNTSSLGSPLRIVEFWSISRHMRKAIVERRPDIIIAHDIYTLKAGSDAARFLGIPLLYDSHEDWPELIGENSHLESIIASKMESRALNRCLSAVVSPCETIAEKFRHNRKSVVLYNAGETPRLLDGMKTDGQRTIGYTGSTEQLKKGNMGEVLLQAMLLLKLHYPPIRLLIAGGPKEDADALRKQAQVLGLSQSVTIMGPLPASQMASIYSTMDLGLILLDNRTTYVNSLPNKLFAYMAHGVPVLAPNYPEIGNVINDSDCGWTFSMPIDAGELARVISDALDLVLLPAFSTIGLNGRMAFIYDYSWEVQEPLFLGLVQALLTEAHQQRSNLLNLDRSCVS